MKLSIFAVSALVLSTSFAAVGWAEGNATGEEASAGPTGQGGFAAAFGELEPSTVGGVEGADTITSRNIRVPDVFVDGGDEHGEAYEVGVRAEE